MNILHVCLSCFYIDNYSYQENLLPKYHKRSGHHVEILASPVNFDSNGKAFHDKPRLPYYNSDNILVTRLPYRSTPFSKHLRRYIGTYEAIKKSQPDIIFVHGLQFIDIKHIIRYKIDHPHVKIFIDNHADFSNSAKGLFSKFILHGLIWRYFAFTTKNFVERYYGVLPSRVEFLHNIYGLPISKIKLLVMGGDDDLIKSNSTLESKINFRRKFGIPPDCFLICTGGKIDHAKTEVIQLIRAIKKLDHPNVKLLIFGTVSSDLKVQFESEINSDRIIFTGWIDAKESYSFFSASDLAIFPGRHSVFWEQVVSQGIPLLVKYWPGIHHLDIGGNVIFVNDCSEESILNTLESLFKSPDKLSSMKFSANSDKKNNFLYSKISQISIDC